MNEEDIRQHDIGERKRQHLREILDGSLSGHLTPPGKLMRILRIAGLDIINEAGGSVFANALTSSAWFVLAIVELGNHIRDEEVDFSPLMEWKFGQAMPVAMLFIYAISAVEASESTVPFFIFIISFSMNHYLEGQLC